MMNKRYFSNEKDNSINMTKTSSTPSPSHFPIQEINQNRVKHIIDNINIKNASIFVEGIDKHSPSKVKKFCSVEANEAQIHQKIKKLNSLNQIQTIKEMLKVTKSNKEPTIGGMDWALPNLPGLCVKHFGEISLPLCSQQAEELIKICKRASYGSNMVDSNAFELEAYKLEIKNDSWNHGLGKLVEKIADGIGCVGKVRANLSKMILFRQGGHFKKHRDEKIEKDMFGTLIIQLPSNYTGGELIVCGNRGAQYKYDFGQANGKSGYSVQYVAYYSDLEHEIEEVKSGYRLVLSYNLCWENGNGILLNDECSEEKVLTVFSILNESFVPLAVILEDKYNDELFQASGTNALKGIDNQRFGFLKNVSAKLPEDKKLNFYIVRTSLVAVDAVDDNPYPYRDNSSDQVSCRLKNEITKAKKIDRLFDSDGKVYQDVKFDFDFFDEIMDLNANETSFDNSQDDSCCDENQYTVCTIYHKYLLMIVPKLKELKLAFCISLSHGVDKVLELRDSHSSNEARFLNYFKLMLKKLKEEPKSGYSSYYSISTDSLREDQINKILDILFVLNDVSLAQFYLANCHCRYVLGDCEKFANLIQQFGFKALKTSLNKFLLPVGRNNIVENLSLIQNLLNLNEEKLAFEVFNECIKPMLVNNNQFSDIKSSSEVFSAKINIDIYSDLLKTILKFEKYAGFETNMDNFKNSIIATLDSNSFEKLFESFIKINKYTSIKQIMDLFKHRFNFLNGLLNSVPEFSWSVSRASIPGYKQFEDFLKSEQQVMTLSGFGSFKQARNFAFTHGGLKDVYSTCIVPNGSGSNWCVTITKTKQFYENYLKRLYYQRIELEKLKLYLNI